MATYDAEYHRQYRVTNKALIAAKNRVRQLARYHVTPEQYSAMLESQGGVCYICGNPETQRNTNGDIKLLSVDHDHDCCPDRTRSCGKCVRGLLCGRCNTVLGAVRESVALLNKMIEYLKGKT